MSRDSATAGIIAITEDFKDQRIPWNDLFKNSNKLDLWVSYASTWRNQYLPQLTAMSNRGASIRVILPDPADDQNLQVLAKRFDMKDSDLKGKIEEAIHSWEGLRAHGGAIEICLSKVTPLFSVYIFNTRAVIAFYNHRKGRIPVPTFICDEDGFMFKYLSKEWEDIYGSSTIK